MSRDLSSRPRTESFVPAVQREMERMIAAGELAGGDRINESVLAIKLGISRGPVREACRALEHTGLLRSEINRGFFVREISTREALDIYDMRASLSALVGRLAAAQVTSAQLNELENLVDRMDEAVERDDLATFYPLNVEFHTRLVACADNHKLVQIWPSLEGELHLFRRRGLLLPGSLRKSQLSAPGHGCRRCAPAHCRDGKARLLRAIASEASARPLPGSRCRPAFRAVLRPAPWSRSASTSTPGPRPPSRRDRPR